MSGKKISRREAIKALASDAAKLLAGRVEDVSVVKASMSYEVVVDREKCTVCGACVGLCEKKAFRLELGEDDVLTLLANSALCDGCMVCSDKCPEKAIEILAAEDRPEDKYVEVASSPIARCRMCGAPIGPAKVLDRVAEKLREKGLEAMVDKIYLCDACRRRSLFEVH